MTEIGAELTPRQLQVKDEFIAVRGTWSPAWQDILELDAEFLHAYLLWSALPARKGHLAPKVREFIFIAADASATHLYTPGIRQHVRAALDAGATSAEIMEVLELTSTLGIHACNIGIPLLIEVLEEGGQAHRAGAADHASGGTQGRVHRQPRVLARVLGRPA
jgi:alkylhydroperoxidase/carboxymuconolactone decarboxylase family protein YurZ